MVLTVCPIPEHDSVLLPDEREVDTHLSCLRNVINLDNLFQSDAHVNFGPEKCLLLGP